MCLRDRDALGRTGSKPCRSDLICHLDGFGSHPCAECGGCFLYSAGGFSIVTTGDGLYLLFSYRPDLFSPSPPLSPWSAGTRFPWVPQGRQSPSSGGWVCGPLDISRPSVDAGIPSVLAASESLKTFHAIEGGAHPFLPLRWERFLRHVAHAVNIPRNILEQRRPSRLASQEASSLSLGAVNRGLPAYNPSYRCHVVHGVINRHGMVHDATWFVG